MLVVCVQSLAVWSPQIMSGGVCSTSRFQPNPKVCRLKAIAGPENKTSRTRIYCGKLLPI
jgi:hypothetical protein